MLVTDVKDIERLHKVLIDIDQGRALPFAAQKSLNTVAFRARTVWAMEGRKKMTVRQPKVVTKAASGFTFSGKYHRVEKARRRKSINQMESRVGNKHRYMAEQEQGVRKVRAGGVQIPQTWPRKNEDHRRLVRTMFWRKNIGKKIGRRYKAGKFSSGRRYAAATIREAREQGKRYVYLKFSRRARGIYDLKRLDVQVRRLNAAKVWDMSKSVTYTKPNPLLRNTLKIMEHDIPRVHQIELENAIRFVLGKRGFRVKGANIMSEVARYRAMQK